MFHLRNSENLRSIHKRETGWLSLYVNHHCVYLFSDLLILMACQLI